MKKYLPSQNTAHQRCDTKRWFCDRFSKSNSNTTVSAGLNKHIIARYSVLAKLRIFFYLYYLYSTITPIVASHALKSMALVYAFSASAVGIVVIAIKLAFGH